MDQQDESLINRSILQRMQMQEMQRRILQSVAGNSNRTGMFAQPNMAPSQPPPGPITGGSSTFPKTIPSFDTRTTPFIPPQPQQNTPLGGSIPPGGEIPQFPGAMPLNNSIIPKTTPGPGGQPPVIDPRTETMFRGQQLANNLPKPPVVLPQLPNTPPKTRSIEEIMQMLKGGDRKMQDWWANPSG